MTPWWQTFFNPNPWDIFALFVVDLVISVFLVGVYYSIKKGLNLG